MIRPGADYADLDTVFGIPLPSDFSQRLPAISQRDETYACKSVENIDVVAGVQIINGAFTINLESIYGEGGKVKQSGR
jgi:hypothetical protein